MADVLQIQCCGVWTDYPEPGHDTECPVCHSTFTVTADSGDLGETLSITAPVNRTESVAAYLAELKSAWDTRVRELNRMSKYQLAVLYRSERPGFVWAAAPPDQWSKDELIDAVLTLDFPAGNGSDPWECPRCHCLFVRPGFDHNPCWEAQSNG